MRKRKQRTPRAKYTEIATQPKFDKNLFASHKHTYSNSIAITNNENMFQQTRNTVGKMGEPYSKIVKQKPKNVVLFTDSMLKSLRRKDFN